ncbi:uncharacterized protein N7483_013010 [Penicillium malachiteum]|uniref:uncharacterized protein n=1 Tax=Penicillium malachiteum TaxID=1324776 RepID=UPI0025478A37|nr:uncharacterized protein N7483_013010 [Penicillium malachiteum]KAJ5715829.1 hypothetical protein N7483_013010 [Penicillium malachiteum]
MSTKSSIKEPDKDPEKPPEANVCAKPDCDKLANKVCTACNPPKTRYCSAKCQKDEFKYHKMSCVGSQKVNCFLIRAIAANGGKEDVDHIEQFYLRSYGDFYAQLEELQSRLGWRIIMEAGQFYAPDPKINHWHYMVFHPDEHDNQLVVNGIASRCLGRIIRGDVAIIRDATSDEVCCFPEEFSRRELLAAVEFYETHDANQTNRNRSGAAMADRMGYPSRFIDGVFVVQL